MRILGIDPGSRLTGFGIVEMQAQQVDYIASGCIRTVVKGALSERLCEIHRGIVEVVQTYRPDVMAIENVFVRHNVMSALKLGQARGVAICAAAMEGLVCHEYSPNEIKQAVVGRGHADKEQVQHMIRALLRLPAAPQADAADALACALCHGHRQQIEQQLRRAQA